MRCTRRKASISRRPDNAIYSFNGQRSSITEVCQKSERMTCISCRDIVRYGWRRMVFLVLRVKSDSAGKAREP